MGEEHGDLVGHRIEEVLLRTLIDTVAGVPRVTNTPPSGDAGARFVFVEEVRIGTMEGSGPSSFGEVAAMRTSTPGPTRRVDDGQT